MAVISELWLTWVGATVYVLDDKGPETPYTFEKRTDLGHLSASPTARSAVVLRGDPLAIPPRLVAPESLAIMAWRAARRTRRVLLLFDEIRRLVNVKGNWLPGMSEAPRAFSEGRAAGLSTFWTTQRPQWAPGEILSETDVLLLFKLLGREVALLEDLGVIQPELARVLRDMPPFSFAVLDQGDWDGQLYRFNLPMS